MKNMWPVIPDIAWDGTNLEFPYGIIARKGIMGNIGKGQVWFVDADMASSGNGKSWSKAFKTVTEALAAASDDDVVMLAPGDYDEGAVLTIDQDNLKLVGAGRLGEQNVAMIYSSSASHHLLIVDANNVEIAGVGFTQTKDTKDGIVLGTGAASAIYKCHIHHCRFDGYGQGEYAISVDRTDADADAPDLVVENCLFRSWQTTGIYANATRDTYRNNIFLVEAATNGIEYIPNTGSRPDGLIYGNIFLGANSTDVGVKVTNTPTAGTLLITNNRFVNCATDVSGGSQDSGEDFTALGLDHLAATAVSDTTDPVDMTEITDDTILANILTDDGDISEYDRRTDSLEAIADAVAVNTARLFQGMRVATKTVTHDGSASYVAFTVTGEVMVKVVGVVTTALTNHGDTTSVGTTTSATGLIAATAGTAMQTADQIWVDSAPSKFESFPATISIIGGGEDIVVDGSANLSGGVVELYCFWEPLSTDGAVVAA